jgi:DNA-binding transcriptional MocR family regulator
VQDGIDAVAFLDPGSLGARQQLQNWQLGTVPVAVDASGLRVDELRATGAAVVVLTPAHQFPMGVVLEGERRRQLLAWATEGGLVVEDDYDAEHRYDRPPLPALRANGGDRVIYMGSVSKLLAPALRIGWVIAPARYHDAFVAAKRNADLGNAVLSQLVLAELVQSGRLERHLRLVRARHRQRRDAMLQALAAHLPTATVHGRAAGLHLTVTFEGRVFRPRTGGTGHMPGHKSAASVAQAAVAPIRLVVLGQLWPCPLTRSSPKASSEVTTVPLSGPPSGRDRLLAESAFLLRAHPYQRRTDARPAN